MSVVIYFGMMFMVTSTGFILCAVSLRHHSKEARRKKIADLVDGAKVVSENPQA